MARLIDEDEAFKVLSAYYKHRTPAQDSALHDALSRVPSADLVNEWCTDCKEYDQTQHCCHRFTKVIRQTQEELKQNAVPKEKILLFLNIANEQLSKAHANKSVNGIMTWSASVTTLEGLLKEYDTADTDIVPVIRCRDCVYFTPEKSGEHWNICRFYDAPKTADGYCNDAERRGEE